MKSSPEIIDQISENQIFVFGSNTEGRHGKGAARSAMKWGAIYGRSKGLQGNTYAICTKELSKGKRSVALDEIKEQIDDLISFAKTNPHLEFLVTKFGCGLGGYEIPEIAGLFPKYIPVNVRLPVEFIQEIEKK